MATIDLRNLQRVMPDGTITVAGVSARIHDGSLVGVIGPSGSGKTTLLRTMAGLERAQDGAVVIDGQDVTALDPRARDVVLVTGPQELHTILSVIEEALLPPVLRRLDGPAPRRRPAAVPRRIVAQAYDHMPAAVLLDDPFARLGPTETAQALAELHSFQKSTGATVVHATNRQRQVLAAADQLLVLRGGELVQQGPPRSVVRQPVTAFVGGFVGDPPMSFVDGRVRDEAGLGWLELGDQRLRIPGGLPGPLRERVGELVRVGARPGPVRVSEAGDPVDLRVTGRVVGIQRTGPVDYVTAEVPGGRWVARSDPGATPRIGDGVEVTVNARSVSVFDHQTGHAIWHGDPSP